MRICRRVCEALRGSPDRRSGRPTNRWVNVGFYVTWRWSYKATSNYERVEVCGFSVVLMNGAGHLSPEELVELRELSEEAAYDAAIGFGSSHEALIQALCGVHSGGTAWDTDPYADLIDSGVMRRLRYLSRLRRTIGPVHMAVLQAVYGLRSAGRNDLDGVFGKSIAPLVCMTDAAREVEAGRGVATVAAVARYLKGQDAVRRKAFIHAVRAEAASMLLRAIVAWREARMRRGATALGLAA